MRQPLICASWDVSPSPARRVRTAKRATDFGQKRKKKKRFRLISLHFPSCAFIVSGVNCEGEQMTTLQEGCKAGKTGQAAHCECCTRLSCCFHRPAGKTCASCVRQTAGDKCNMCHHSFVPPKEKQKPCLAKRTTAFSSRGELGAAEQLLQGFLSPTFSQRISNSTL